MLWSKVSVDERWKYHEALAALFQAANSHSIMRHCHRSRPNCKPTRRLTMECREMERLAAEQDILWRFDRNRLYWRIRMLINKVGIDSPDRIRHASSNFVMTLIRCLCRTAVSPSLAHAASHPYYVDRVIHHILSMGKHRSCNHTNSTGVKKQSSRISGQAEDRTN